MLEFLYKITPTRGDMLVTGPTERESAIIDQHFDYLKALTDSGQVLMAGRTTTEDANTFGIIVFRAESLSSAEKLVQNDPAVMNKVMSAQLYPFRVSLWSDKDIFQTAGFVPRT
jgi:uncharacterized protein YciI